MLISVCLLNSNLAVYAKPEKQKPSSDKSGI